MNNPCHRVPNPWNRGFSLTELAIVLVIVSLLIGSLMPLLVRQDLQGNIETEKTLHEIREALIGYAMVNGYLPCPAPTDLSTNGEEGTRVSGACPLRVGLLPWATLGVPRLDYWGRYFHYSASAAFSDGSSKFTLASSGDITVRTRDNAGSLVTLASKVPAVVVSHGKNGAWALGDAGTTLTDTSSTNTDEDANGDTSPASYGTIYVSRAPTGLNDKITGGEFDDSIGWLSSNVLFSRMVAAGKLP